MLPEDLEEMALDRLRHGNARIPTTWDTVKLITFIDQIGFIFRCGKLGVAYFGEDRRFCVGWDYVSDFRGPDNKAQTQWVEITLWPPSVRKAKWKPI